MNVSKDGTREAERLRAVHALNLLDSKREEIYERITRVAVKLFNAYIATVSVVDKDRVWFKSIQGFDICEIEREKSLCNYAINQDITDDQYSRIIEIGDTKLDPKFSDNPLVLEKPWIRYYMGYVLQTRSKQNIGTLCVLDQRPRQSSIHEKNLLIDLGKMVEDRITEMDIATNLNIDDVAGVSNVAEKVFSEINLLLKRKGIGLMEWRVLDQIIQSEFALPSQISKELEVANSQMSKILDSLETKGLVNRVRTLKNCDRRLVKLECSQEGKKVWRYGQQLSEKVVDKLRTI